MSRLKAAVRVGQNGEDVLTLPTGGVILRMANVRKVNPAMAHLVPDLQRYFWWRAMSAKYPGGLILKAEAGRLLGISNQGVNYRLWAFKLRGERDPDGREYIPLKDVLGLFDDARLEEIQESTQFNREPNSN